MLNYCTFEGRQLHFGSGPYTGQNRFTVIVGKNGTGKSRLLSAIVKDLINKHYLSDFHAIKPPFPVEEIEVDYYDFPRKVVAASTNPFDKFPLEGRQVGSELYNYLGLRGLQTTNLGLTFMARILGNLIRAILRDRSRAEVIKATLSHLGYVPHIRARLLFQLNQNEIDEFRSAADPVEFILSRNFRLDRFSQRSQYTYSAGRRKPYDRADEEKAYELAKALKDVINHQMPSRLDLLLNENGVVEERYNFALTQGHIALMEAGLLRLKDVELQKIWANKPFKINDASSGEQCVLMSLLGIASQIEDNTLICIDEPEVCLHPEWQEQYIERLISTFQRFYGCHFIIATHSPQIVANLRRDNCFVVDIETATTIAALKLTHRSADYQLANVFRAPGFRNEYLSRELLATLANLSSEVVPSEKILNKARNLLQLSRTLHPDDPLNELMKLLYQALAEVSN
jgi:predicted ATPase